MFKYLGKSCWFLKLYGLVFYSFRQNVCTGEPPEGYNVEVRPSIPSTHSSIEDTSLCTEHFTDFFHHVEYSVSSFYYILNSGVVRVDPLVLTLLFLFCRLLEIIKKRNFHSWKSEAARKKMITSSSLGVPISSGFKRRPLSLRLAHKLSTLPFQVILPFHSFLQ